MSNETKSSWLVRLGSFCIAALLLYLGLRGVDLEAVWQSLTQSNWWWMIPIVGITVISHWLRTVRWILLLEASPSSESSDLTDQTRTPISTWHTFLAVMVGYMANYAGPRLGELIRTGYVSKRQNIPFSTVLGTVVVERSLDMLAFGIALLSVPLVFSSQIAALFDLLVQPLTQWLADTSTLALAFSILGITLLFVLGGWFLWKGIGANGSRIKRFASQFRGGVLSIFHTGKTGLLVLQTISMWLCYGLMAYLPFLLLDQANLFNIGPMQAWGIMLIGAIGVIIPSPGGIGTFHYITIQALGLLFAMPQTDAATYAILAHSGQMLLYLLLGFFGFLILGSSIPKADKSAGTQPL